MSQRASPASGTAGRCRSIGIVLALNGPLARVRTPLSGPCSDCSCQGRPGPVNASRRTVIARNLIGARPGDRVLLQEPKNESFHTPSRLLWTFCTLCLAGMFAGAFTLAWFAPLGHQDCNVGLGALCGLICAALIQKHLVAPRLDSLANTLPVIAEALPGPGAHGVARQAMDESR